MFVFELLLISKQRVALETNGIVINPHGWYNCPLTSKFRTQGEKIKFKGRHR